MPSLVDLVDQLHQDYRIGHFPSSIVQDGVDIPLIVTDQRDVKAARSSWLLFPSGTLFKGPRVRSLSDLVLEPVHLFLSGCTEV